jgi:hypothetical protein
MSEPLSDRTKELQAMSREKLKVGLELLPGHTTLRVYMFNLRFTEAGLLTVRGQK